MAWGKSSPPKSSGSIILKLIPLVIFIAILGGIGFVGYHLYLSFTKMSDAASEKMNKKNVVFTKDGLKVGVKEIRNENYVDQTQSWVVKAWNLGNTKGEQELSKKKKK